MYFFVRKEYDYFLPISYIIHFFHLDFFYFFVLDEYEYDFERGLRTISDRGTRLRTPFFAAAAPATFLPRSPAPLLPDTSTAAPAALPASVLVAVAVVAVVVVVVVVVVVAAAAAAAVAAAAAAVLVVVVVVVVVDGVRACPPPSSTVLAVDVRAAAAPAKPSLLAERKT